MNILVWLYRRFHKEESHDGKEARDDAEKSLEEESCNLDHARELAVRAEKSRKKDGYGEALRRAFGG